MLAKHFHNVGYAHHAQGNVQAAVGAYAWALDFEPGRFITLKNLGDAYIKSRQYQPAIECLEAAVRQQPADESLHFTLGNLYLFVGRIRDAEIAYRNAVRLKPDHSEAFRRLAKAIFAQALAHLKEEDPDLARRAYERGMEIAGVAEAERLGVFRELKEMINDDAQAAHVRAILKTYGREP